MWKAREYVIVHSKDDELVPFAHGERLAERLKARLVETNGDGHYMNEQYPVLLETIQKIAKTPFEFDPGMTLGDDYANLPEL